MKYTVVINKVIQYLLNIKNINFNKMKNISTQLDIFIYLILLTKVNIELELKRLKKFD